MSAPGEPYSRCCEYRAARVRRILSLSDERDLILQIRQPVVDRRRRQHEHLGFRAFPDDPAHEAVIPSFAIRRAVLVPEVVGLVDHDEVVVPPVHIRQIDVPRHAAVAGEICVIQDVVVEAIGSEDVPPVVRFVETPVVSKALGDEHQNTVIAELVVLNDRQRLKRLTETDAVRDDAASESVDLVDRTNDAIALKFEQLLPDRRLADARCRLDNPVFIEVSFGTLKQVMKREEVDELRRAAWRSARRSDPAVCASHHLPRGGCPRAPRTTG